MAAKTVARATDMADSALDDELLGSAEAPRPSGWATLWPKLRDLANHNPKILAGLLFVAGLFIGWMILGWLVFPIHWTDTDPWDMRLEHQMRYVELVAADYWQSGDLARVNASLDGWDPEGLADVIRLVMVSDKVSAESRAQVSALAEALAAPMYDESLWGSLLSNQKAIVFGFVISALPLMLAVGLVVAPMLKQVGAAKAEADALEEAQDGVDAEDSLERLIGDVEVGDDEEEEEAEEEEEELVLSEEQSQEMASEINNMLSGLFEDDNQNTEQMTALAKTLGDVDMPSLQKRAQLVASLLASSLWLRDHAN